MEKTVTLLWGLPASGKTHYTKEAVPRPRSRLNKIAVVDVDRLLGKIKPKDMYKEVAHTVVDVDRLLGKIKPKDMYKEVAHTVLDNLHSNTQVIIDSLCTTNEVANNIFANIVSYQYEKEYHINYEIIWWEPDIAACLHNDRGRRKIDSKITIENIAFEEPSKELIETWKIKVTKKQIVRKPEWQAWAQENDVHEMKSDSWSLGGIAGSCYGGTRTVSASEQPTTFQNFDDLLEKICPNLSFLQYKKLYATTVTVQIKNESDYYGGCVTYACYACDMQKLYTMLKELGVIS